MEVYGLLEKLDSLLLCGSSSDGDVNDKGKDKKLPSPHQIVAYKYERFLVSWILLTRLPQEQLDRAWKKHGKDLSLFAICLLTNINDDNGVVIDTSDVMSKNGMADDKGSCDVMNSCFIRLFAQVTVRLTIPPSSDLRRALYNSWNRSTAATAPTDLAKISPKKAKLPNSNNIALNVDVYDAFVAWMDLDVAFFSSREVMEDIWDTYIVTHTTILQRSVRVGLPVPSPCQNDDKTTMFNVFESLLGKVNETQRASAYQDSGHIYTIDNLQRLTFMIFEMRKNNLVPEELLCRILNWASQSNQEDFSNIDMKLLWHEWIMRNVKECILKKRNCTTLLRDPKSMDAMQKITLMHVVSPNVHSLRPLAWKTFSIITKTYGWSWIQKSSMKSSISTWCRLACGEWKIQLEENSLERSYNLTILDGCGKLILSVAQYLVDITERPDKTIPFETKELLIIRESFEEILSLTSEYLNASFPANDCTEPALMINLWCELFSEMDLTTLKEAGNVMACFRMLLSLSSDESLVVAVVHIITTHYIEEKLLVGLVEDFDKCFLNRIIVYMERFWQTLAKPHSLEKWYENDIVNLACVAVEILAENQPDRIRQLSNTIFDAVAFLVESFRIASIEQRINLRQSLRLIVDFSMSSPEVFGDTRTSDNHSRCISSAIELLEEH